MTIATDFMIIKKIPINRGKYMSCFPNCLMLNTLREQGRVIIRKFQKFFSEIGKEMLFLFDYGDNWKFIVKLEYAWEEIASARYPVILRAVGKVPEQYPACDEAENEHGNWFHEDCSLCRALKEQGIEMKWHPDDPEGEDLIN